VTSWRALDSQCEVLGAVGRGHNFQIVPQAVLPRPDRVQETASKARGSICGCFQELLMNQDGCYARSRSLGEHTFAALRIRYMWLLLRRSGQCDHPVENGIQLYPQH
jgi:hypothetical protein